MRISVRQPSVRSLMVRLLSAGLHAADPASAVCRKVTRTGSVLKVGNRSYDLRTYQRVVVAGAGKASARMAAGIEKILGATIAAGLVIVKYGHAVPTKIVRVLEAGHPVPDRAGRQGTVRVLDLVKNLTRKDLLVVLVSGGASSLLAYPASSLTLRHKRQTTQLLLRSGATIQEINTVRKHLSSVKGGGLAAATRATMVSLILSDVVGDDPTAIGSGPTVPDPTTYAEAGRVLHRYGLWSKVPPLVRTHLSRGIRGRIPETPKPGTERFRRVQNSIIGSNTNAVEEVARAAGKLGVSPLILSTSLVGEARAVAKIFGAMAREMVMYQRPIRPPACVIAGGELTVTVRGKGIGGRAQEFALAAALEIDGQEGVWIAGFGTDGTDGPTTAAGAVVDGATVNRARRLGLDPGEMLDRSDSWAFFKKLGGHILTGPTGTNVNDLYLLLVL